MTIAYDCLAMPIAQRFRQVKFDCYIPVHKCWPKTSYIRAIMGWKPGYLIIKISTHLATQEPLTAFHGIKQNKIPKWPTQKNYVFQNRQFSIFFRKIERDWSLGQ